MDESSTVMYGVILVLVLGIGAFLWLRGTSEPQPQVPEPLPSNMLDASAVAGPDEQDLVLNMDTRMLGYLEDEGFRVVRAASYQDIQDCAKLNWYRTT